MPEFVQPIRDYSKLTIEQIQRRLSLAEDLALMFSWSPSRRDTDRDKAAHELWLRWKAEAGDSFTDPARHPHLQDPQIAPLVAERDATRERTLSRIRANR